jgi:hypothetical protein
MTWKFVNLWGSVEHSFGVTDVSSEFRERKVKFYLMNLLFPSRYMCILRCFIVRFQELRRRYNSTLLIQAFVRGYLTRQQCKKIQRAAFDETVQQNTFVGHASDEQTLSVLIQRLLFFYSEEEDSSRLVCL